LIHRGSALEAMVHQKLLLFMLSARHDGDNVLVSKTIQRLQKRLFETLQESSRPDSSGQPHLRLTPYGKEVERKQQQRRVGRAYNTELDRQL